MKTILVLALVLGLCGVARARDEKAEPVGTWKCAYAIGDLQRTATLTITKDGDKLAGTITWPDQKDAKLKDVKLKDGELTFSAERVVGDNKLTVEYKFAINGDTLKGKAQWRTGAGRRSSTSRGSGRRRTSSSWEKRTRLFRMASGHSRPFRRQLCRSASVPPLDLQLPPRPASASRPVSTRRWDSRKSRPAG